MKSLLFIVFIAFTFTACNQDIKTLSKTECKKLGYKFLMKKRLNYRTGKYEIETLCLNNRQ